jgi:hypothetical protein
LLFCGFVLCLFRFAFLFLGFSLLFGFVFSVLCAFVASVFSF